MNQYLTVMSKPLLDYPRGPTTSGPLSGLVRLSHEKNEQEPCSCGGYVIWSEHPHRASGAFVCFKCGFVDAYCCVPGYGWDICFAPKEPAQAEINTMRDI